MSLTTKNQVYQAALKGLQESLNGAGLIDHFKVDVEHARKEIVPENGCQLSLTETEPTEFDITITPLTPWAAQHLHRARLLRSVSISDKVRVK